MLTLFVLAMTLSSIPAQERLAIQAGTNQSAMPPANAQASSSTDKEQGYRVSGIVVNAATGAPLPEAQVSLTSNTTQDSEGMLTDDNGRFAFEDVPAGKYVLSAKRKGYLEQLYKQHQQFSTAIVTGPGLNTENLRFELRGGASISGVVTDEAGEPVRNAQVTLIQRELFTGRRSTFQRGATGANDLGRFRFGQLMPGTYFIAVSATPWYAQRSQQVFYNRPRNLEGSVQFGNIAPEFTPPEPELDVVYPMTFFPNSPDLAGAAPIILHSGDTEVADIRLQAVPGAHLTVRTPLPKEGANVWANVTQELIDGQRVQVLAATQQQIAPGVLEISGLPMGRMDIDLSVNTNDGTRAASHRQSVQVSGGNAEINIGEAAPPVKFSGLARFDDGSGFAITPHFQLKSTATDAWYQLASQNDGTFDLEQGDLPPGPYEIWIMQNREGAAVRSIKATNAKVSSERAFDVTGAGDVKLEVLLSRGDGRITGFAFKDGKPLDGVMVALVPDNPEHNLVLFRRDQSDSDGSFTLPGVHPGKYTVLALENGWEVEWMEPGVLKKYLARGERIEVTPNATLDLRLNVQ